jgi:SAM-dependent methyltransferase
MPDLINAYDVDSHIAEIYDQIETTSDDVDLIRRLIGSRGPLRILEPFCGTGRILLPLALDGHTLAGLDQAGGILARARLKLAGLADEVRQRVTLVEADVLRADWPQGFDVVILGGNCFYELATPEEQEHCIRQAAASLRPGGWVYLDNNHMEGDLDPAWQQPGIRRNVLSGLCADGTRVENTSEVVWYDVARRLAHFRRHTVVTCPDGTVIEKEYVQQKHPVSAAEVQGWLDAQHFVVEQRYGDRAGNPYTDQSSRAIFWAATMR